ncbi:MAG: hypothetical protein HC802_17690, partial [Caldilineaceae bacterium]|nr:hypothetical protein [Caldilineaceae bacterium]
ITGGELRAENHAHYGLKEPRWFSHAELADLFHYPAPAIAKAFARQKRGEAQS